MWGCCSDAASWISRWKRSALMPAASSGGEDLHDDLSAERHLLGQEHATHPRRLRAHARGGIPLPEWPDAVLEVGTDAEKIPHAYGGVPVLVPTVLD